MHFRLDDSRCTPDYAYSTSSRCTSDSMTVDALPTTLTRHRYDALSTRRYPSAKTVLRIYAKWRLEELPSRRSSLQNCRLLHALEAFVFESPPNSSTQMETRGLLTWEHPPGPHYWPTGRHRLEGPLDGPPRCAVSGCKQVRNQLTGLRAESFTNTSCNSTRLQP